MSGHNQIDPARDDEHALRLVRPDDYDFEGERITSAAFRTRKPDHKKYRSVSMYVKERLPDNDGDLLHKEKFEEYGRGCLSVEEIRGTGVDLVMTGEAEPPLEEFADAHGELRGETYRKAVARELARVFNEQGCIERLPEKPPSPPPPP